MKINGVKVSTNKTVLSVVNSVVSFTDGSSCDVATGKINNVGSGYIKLKGSGVKSYANNNQSEEKKSAVQDNVENTKIFESKSWLYLRHISIPVVIDVNEDPACDEITVSTEGFTVSLENRGVIINQTDDVLRVEMSGSNTDVQSSVISNISDSSITISNSTIGGRFISVNDSVVGREDGSSANILESIHIKVPLGIGVKFEHSSGKLSIGNLHGPVIGESSGAGTVEIGSVKGADLRITGSSRVAVSLIYGDSAMLNLAGAGFIKVDLVNLRALNVISEGVGGVKLSSGTAELLTCRQSGVGSIKFEGTAGIAYLKNTGVGSIKVKHAGRVEQDNKGVGSIKVVSVGKIQDNNL